MDNEFKILNDQDFVDAIYASSWLLSLTMSNYVSSVNRRPCEDKIYQQLRRISRMTLSIYEYSKSNISLPTQYDLDDREFVRLIISKYGGMAWSNLA
jgi:hypothetical protein